MTHFLGNWMILCPSSLLHYVDHLADDLLPACIVCYDSAAKQ